MAGAIMNKVWDFFGMDTAGKYDEPEEDLDNYITRNEEDYDEENRGLFGKRGKILSMAQNQQVKVVILQPTTFEQAESICDLLKEKRAVIVNLEYVNNEVARRIVDVISGATHALDGHIQKISNSIFLIAPFNYDITNEMAREEIKNKVSVSWLRN